VTALLRISARFLSCVSIAVVSCAAASAVQEPAAGLKRVDTGYGFSIDLPAGLERGPQAGNARLVFSNLADDFTVVVANFGATQKDTAAASSVYRESFAKAGMSIETETDVVVSSVAARRYVMTFDSPSGPGRAEAVLFPSGDEVFGVVIVVPAATVDARRPMIGRVLDSIRLVR